MGACVVDVEEQLARARHDVSVLMASVEVLQRNQNLHEQLRADLRRAHQEKQAFLARAESLEMRAEQLERLTEQIEAETIRRAELSDWRRAERRTKLLMVIAALLAVAFISWQLFLHAHDAAELQAQQQETKQSLCGFLDAASQLRATAQSRAFAAEAGRLHVEFGCPRG